MKFTGIITIGVAILAVASASPLGKRRFGQEHTPRADADFQAMKDIAVGTGFDAQLGDLSGAAVRALLAKAPACDQQDVADQMIDIARQIQKQGKSDSESKFQQLVNVAKDYRTLERNTPQAGQPSELCTRQPRNPELDGLTQAQDPTGPNNGSPSNVNPSNGNPGNGNPGTCNAQTVTVTSTTTMTATATTTMTATGAACTTPPATNPTDPANPTTPADPANPANPADPMNPTNPANPADPANPANPTDPTNPTTPANDGKSASTPGTIITLDNTAFTNPIAGIAPPQIIVNQDGNPSVNGDRFLQLQNAVQRACDVQKNQCFNKFNSGDRTFQGSDCENQHTTCPTGNTVFS